MIVLRTFSKAAGIAGLRLGYGIFPDWLMPVLWKYKQPYNVNVAASVAGLASLSQPEQMRDVVAKLTAERARLYEQLESAPQLEPVTGSQANFILCKVVGRDALALKEALERRGILVRHYTSAGLENCIRISVGRPDQTDALMALRAPTDCQRIGLSLKGGTMWPDGADEQQICIIRCRHPWAALRPMLAAAGIDAGGRWAACGALTGRHLRRRIEGFGNSRAQPECQLPAVARRRRYRRRGLDARTRQDLYDATAQRAPVQGQPGRSR